VFYNSKQPGVTLRGGFHKRIQLWSIGGYSISPVPSACCVCVGGEDGFTGEFI